MRAESGRGLKSHLRSFSTCNRWYHLSPRGDKHHAINLASSPENRLSVRLFFTASASAFPLVNQHDQFLAPGDARINEVAL